MTWTWSWSTSLVALATATDGVFWSSTMSAWTGWPLMPPAALVASTQSWKTVFASAVEPAPAPVKEPMAPTTNGVPLALLLALLLALALAGVPAAVLAGALVELDDEDEQPAAVSAARASAVTATPVDLRPARLRPVSLRVILPRFCPGTRPVQGG